MKVYIIHEECHGTIGIAKDIESAIKWLIDEKWITESTDVYYEINDENENEAYTVSVAFGSEWKSYLIGLADNETLLDEELERMGFYIYIEEVIGG